MVTPCLLRYWKEYLSLIHYVKVDADHDGTLWQFGFFPNIKSICSDRARSQKHQDRDFSAELIEAFKILDENSDGSYFQSHPGIATEAGNFLEILLDTVWKSHHFLQTLLGFDAETFETS